MSLIPRHRSLGCESLEDRCLLSVFSVTNLSDSGAGSLRAAVAAANNNAGADTITFDSSLVGQTISLTSGELDITDTTGTTTISGLGANQLTISGENASRVFYVGDNAAADISGLTITKGSVGGDAGGGILNEGTLTLTNSVVSDSAASSGGGICNGGDMTLQGTTVSSNSAENGSGVFNAGTMTIDTCIISNNSESSSTTSYAGGLYNSGTLTMTGTDILGNSAAYGGGVYNDVSSTLTVNGGQISGNASLVDGGGIMNMGDLSATGVNISNNTATRYGGGVDNYGVGTATLSGVTISGNTADYGGGVINWDGCTLTVLGGSSISGNAASATGQGGGFYNNGVLAISGSTVYGNAAAFGGGISNWGTLTIAGSTLAANQSSNSGGALYNAVSAIIDGSTFSDNYSYYGGAVSNDATGTVSLTNVTLANNTALYGGGIGNKGTLIAYDATVAYNKANAGGGIYVEDGCLTTTLSNTLVADNTNSVTPATSPDIYGTVTANYCLIGNTTGVTLSGTSANNLLNIDPLLGTLGDNGGSTQTVLLQVGSPAVNAGSNALIPSSTTTDQRGYARIIDGVVDIGAYERELENIDPFIVTTADDVVNGTDGLTSLREAITAANSHAGADTITFDSSLIGDTITLTLGELDITDTTGATTIVGLGSANLTVDGNGASRVFYVGTGATAVISGVTVTGGSVGVHAGGGILNDGTLTLTNSTISGNNGLSGGGVCNGGDMTLSGDTISGNTGENGAGVFNAGTMTISDTEISSNTGAAGGYYSFGGGVFNSGTLTMTDTTVSTNSADYGGGIYGYVGGALTVNGGEISGNSASYDGGGIVNQGDLSVTGATISGNTAVGDGGGIDNYGAVALTAVEVSGNSAAQGGGIVSWDGCTLTIADSEISANAATAQGGGIYNGTGVLTISGSTVYGNAAPFGGGISNWGSLTITGSTLASNQASNAGGGLFNGASSTITSSTFSGNWGYYGGAICNDPTGTVAITNVTLADNTAYFGGAIGNKGVLTADDTTVAYNAANVGGGIYVEDGCLTTTLSNTLVADNTNSVTPATSPDIYGTVTANYCLVGDTAGVTLSGTSANNLLDIDPLLGTLGNHGGATQTIALLANSPAINAGKNSRVPSGVTTDQRGYVRIANGTVDIGAYESDIPTVALTAPAYTNHSTPTITVTASDANADLPAGTVVYVDVDLNGDGDFTDAGEAGYVTGSLNSAGTATIVVSPALANGTYSLQARVTNAAGDEGTSAVQTMVVDAVVPTATIGAPSLTATATQSVTYLVTCTDGQLASGFSASDILLQRTGTANGIVSLLAVVGSTSSYIVTVSGITGDGTLAIQLPAGMFVDLAGNGSLATTGASFVVDTKAPTVTLTVPAITNDGTPSITVSATDAGVGVANGAIVYLDVDLNSDGDFADTGETGYATGVISGGTATLTPVMADGVYRLRARVADAVGNEGVSAVQSMLVDATAPTLTWTSATPANSAGWNNTNVTLTYTVSDNLSGVAGSFPASPIVLTTEGSSVTATVTVTDNAGNTAVFTSASFKVDKTAATVTLTAPAATNNVTPAITITAADGGSGVADGTTVYLDVDLNNDGDFTDASEAGYATGTLVGGTVTLTPGFANGTYGLRARAADVADNQGTSAVHTMVVDTVAPSVLLTAPAVTNDTTPTITIEAAVADGATAYLDVDLNNDGDFTDIGESGCATGTIVGGVATLNPSFADGTYRLQARVSDTAGNQGVSVIRTMVIDTVAPTVTLTAPALTNVGTPTIAIAASSDATTYYLDIDLNNDGDFTDPGEAGYATGTLSSGTAAFPLTPALVDGTYQLRARAIDAAGNQGMSSVAPMVVDTVAPAVTLAAPALTNSGTPTVTVTAAVADGTTVYLDVDLNNDGDFTDAGETAYATGTIVGGTATLTPALADGTYRLQARASDGAGNEGTSTVHSMVVDTTAPTVTLTVDKLTNTSLPSAVVTAADAGSGIASGATVYLDVDLNNDGDFTDAGETGYATGSLSSGQWVFAASTAFADGRYNLRARTSDVAGNEGASQISPMTVSTHPAISNVVVAASTSANKTSITWTETDPNGLCGGSTTLTIDGKTVRISKRSYGKTEAHFSYSGKLAAGTHTFTIMSTDSKGETSSYTDTFTVAATTPVISKVKIKATTSAKNSKISWKVADIDGIGAVSLTIDGTVVTSGFTLSGSITSRTFTYTGHLAAGTHTYEINASDSTGLAATPVSGTFVVKATAPVISSVRKQVGTDVTATIITWMVNDIDGVGTVKLTIDGIDVTGIVKSGTSTSAVFTYTAVLSAGTHSYAITAYDSTGLAGKLAKGSFKVKSAMFASTMATGVTAGTAKTDWLVDYSFAGSSSVNANSVDAVFAAS